jgi:hypothetical protein
VNAAGRAAAALGASALALCRETGGIVLVLARVVRSLIRASADPIVRQFVSGSASGPMETPGF